MHALLAADASCGMCTPPASHALWASGSGVLCGRQLAGAACRQAECVLQRHTLAWHRARQVRVLAAGATMLPPWLLARIVPPPCPCRRDVHTSSSEGYVPPNCSSNSRPPLIAAMPRMQAVKAAWTAAQRTRRQSMARPQATHLEPQRVCACIPCLCMYVNTQMKAYHTHVTTTGIILVPAPLQNALVFMHCTAQ